jgi:hypothetical protein
LNLWDVALKGARSQEYPVIWAGRHNWKDLNKGELFQMFVFTQSKAKIKL